MNRDLLKTIGGVLLIAAIVIATFIYGNKQRQEQIRRDQEQQQNGSSNQPVTDQGGQPAPSPDGVGGGQTPAPTPSTTPATGPEVVFLAPLAVIAALYQLNRVSKRAVKEALLS